MQMPHRQKNCTKEWMYLCRIPSDRPYEGSSGQAGIGPELRLREDVVLVEHPEKSSRRGKTF